MTNALSCPECGTEIPDTGISLRLGGPGGDSLQPARQHMTHPSIVWAYRRRSLSIQSRQRLQSSSDRPRSVAAGV
jgi:hypothetical protein